MNQSRSADPLNALRMLATRRPIALFLVVALGLTFLIMLLAILVQYGVVPGASLPGWFGLDMERATSLVALLLGLFPAAILVTALEGGRPAVRALFRWRIGVAWWLVVVVTLPASTIALALLMGDTLRTPGVSVLASEVVGIAVAFLLINLWEETAWAGFLQTRLERRHNIVVAAALTAIPFAAFHMPLQVINGNTEPLRLAAAFGLLLILGCVVRPLLGLVLRGAGDSLMATGLMHTFFNRSNNFDGIAADLLAGPNRPIAAPVATLPLTVAIAVCIRRRLSRGYRRELHEMHSTAMRSSGNPGMSIGHTSVA